MTYAKRYAVFLSHHQADQEEVQLLAHKLQAEGLDPFLDRWHLIPGEPWQEAIEAALEDSQTCAIFLGPGGLGPWENEQMRTALDERVHQPEFRVIPVLLPSATMPDRGRLPRFLSRLTWIDFRAGLAETNKHFAEEFYRLCCGIRGMQPIPTDSQALQTDECPYRGLQAFHEEHAKFFYGRAALTQWLVEALRSENRFLAVLGASGSGKSSVVRAGLTPALRAGKLPGSEHWLIATMKPGARPLEALAALIAPHLPDDKSQALRLLQWQDDLRKDERTLHAAARLLTARDSVGRFLIIVDQFEETFTQCQDAQERQRFLDNLLYAADIVQGNTLVVLTMRSDFYTHASAYPTLIDHIAAHQVNVTPMSVDELRQAMEAPAQQVGLSLDPGLVDNILAEIADRPGILPLLEHTLEQLWQHRVGRRLTFDSYRAIGGVHGALARWAEKSYADLTPEQQKAADRLLLRLVQLAEGRQPVRDRVPLSHLEPAAVVEKLISARLLTTEQAAVGEETLVTVAHEALFDSWPRLQQLVRDSAADLAMRHALAQAAQEWQAHEQDDSYLYHGTRLDRVLDWAAVHSHEVEELEDKFLDRSQKQRDLLEASEQTQLTAITNLAYELPRILQETQKPLEIQAQIAQVLIHNLTQVTNLANLANLKLRYLRELATCYRLLGSTLYELDELTKAQAAFAESVTLCEELVKRVPTEPFWQRDLAVSHYNLGRIWQRKGNKRKACQAYKLGWASATKAVDLGYINPDLKTLLASSETTMQQLGCR